MLGRLARRWAPRAAPLRSAFIPVRCFTHGEVHNVEFHHKDVKAASEWKVEKEWVPDWHGILTGLADKLTAQREYQKKHGEAPVDTAFNSLIASLEAAGLGEKPTSTGPDELDKRIEALLSTVTPENGKEELEGEQLEEFNSILEALEAQKDALFDSQKPVDESTLPADVQEKLAKFNEESQKDALVDSDDEILYPEASEEAFERAAAEWELEPFDRPINEKESTEFLLGYDAPIDIERDMREFNEHTTFFPAVKLERKEDTLPANSSDDLKQLARLLSEHPGISGNEIDGLLEYYQSVVNKTITPLQPLGEQFPAAAIANKAQPWTLKVPVDYPGEELANRLNRDGRYRDLDTPLRKELAEKRAKEDKDE